MKSIEERAKEKYHGGTFSPFMRDAYIQGAEDQQEFILKSLDEWVFKKYSVDLSGYIELYKKEQNESGTISSDSQ